MTQPTIQSGGPINGADAITIELIQPYSMPAVVRIVWPTAATITTPARYLEVAAAAMKVLAEASTTLARSEPAKLQATGAAIVKVLSTRAWCRRCAWNHRPVTDSSAGPP